MSHPKEFAQGLSIGIIMDGNGRWAKQRGLPALPDIKKGRKCLMTLPTIAMSWAWSRYISTPFRLKTGNALWKRVNGIMRLLGEYLIRGFQYGRSQYPYSLSGRPHCVGPLASGAHEQAGTGFCAQNGHDAECGGQLRRPPGAGPGSPQLGGAGGSRHTGPGIESRSRLCLTICILPGKKTRISSCVPAEKNACPTLCSGRRPIRSWWRWMSSGRTLPGRT